MYQAVFFYNVNICVYNLMLYQQVNYCQEADSKNDQCHIQINLGL
jgi:hypothetical protein